MPTTTNVDERLTLRQRWRKDGILRYEVGMSSMIIILNIEAILYMIIHKIPLVEEVILAVVFLSFSYVAIGSTVFLCCIVVEDDSLLAETYFVLRFCHTLGFCNFLCLLYCISHLATYIGLSCLLWFVPAMIAPCCPCVWRGEPAWWNFVKQPQSTLPIV